MQGASQHQRNGDSLGACAKAIAKAQNEKSEFTEMVHRPLPLFGLWQ
jgi:hypothetical protein